MKKWVSNNDELNAVIPEGLESISNTKQVDIEPNAQGSSVLGLQWNVTDDSLQVCRGSNKEVKVSSVFDPIGLFAPFSVRMRRLLKNTLAKFGQHCDNKVEPGEEAEFLKWKEQLPIVARTSIDRRYFSILENKIELHVFADASEDTMCAVAYLRLQPKEYSAGLAFVIGKFRVAPMRHLSSSGDCSEIERTNCQRTRDEDTQLQFLDGIMYSTAMDTQLSPQTKSFCRQPCS